MTTADERPDAGPDLDDWDNHWDAYGEAAENNPANEYRAQLILRLLGRPPAGATVLDIGSGQGQFALRLQRMYPDLSVWGAEYSAVGVARSQSLSEQQGGKAQFRQVDLLQPTMLPAGQPAATYAICSEVLEHVADPTTLIRNARELLAPGCHLVVTVPGGPRSAFDHHIGHFQHFNPAKLRRVLTDAGYDVRRVMRTGFPVFNLYKLAIIARGKRLIKSIEGRGPDKPTSRVESLALSFFGFGFRHTLDQSPFGWQIAAVARVPGVS
jgi:SAM-dependent methyltransferase